MKRGPISVRRHHHSFDMNTELIKIGFPAAIALVGTIITVAVGYRQWKRQQGASHRNALQNERASAYKELWEKLEEVHIRLRGRERKSPRFAEMLREVNTFAMKHGLLIDEKDREKATAYLEAVQEYCSIVRESGDEDARDELPKTTAIPLHVLERVERLGPAQERMSALRSQIIERFRKVIEIE